MLTIVYIYCRLLLKLSAITKHWNKNILEPIYCRVYYFCHEKISNELKLDFSGNLKNIKKQIDNDLRNKF